MLLLPQGVVLFDYEACFENKSREQIVLSDQNMSATKQEKIILEIEKFIMTLNYKFFHKSCITDRHFRTKRSLVDLVLTDLVNRQLLHQGHDEKSFFHSGRVSTIKTYLKFLPSTNDEERFRNTLSNLYNINYEEYIKCFEAAPLLPSNCKLTPYGSDFVAQPQYAPFVDTRKGSILCERIFCDISNASIFFYS